MVAGKRARADVAGASRRNRRSSTALPAGRPPPPPPPPPPDPPTNRGGGGLIEPTRAISTTLCPFDVRVRLTGSRPFAIESVFDTRGWTGSRPFDVRVRLTGSRPFEIESVSHTRLDRLSSI